MKKDVSTSNPSEKNDSRRQFLQSASVAAGALVLTRTLPAEAQVAAETAAPVEAPPTILNLSEHKDLEKVGGWEVIEIGNDKVIVAHTETGFTACSAVCTHKGCIVEYRVADKQFVCPCHGARFDESGKVVKGPAKVDLKPFEAANALVVKKR